MISLSVLSICIFFFGKLKSLCVLEREREKERSLQSTFAFEENSGACAHYQVQISEKRASLHQKAYASTIGWRTSVFVIWSRHKEIKANHIWIFKRLISQNLRLLSDPLFYSGISQRFIEKHLHIPCIILCMHISINWFLTNMSSHFNEGMKCLLGEKYGAKQLDLSMGKKMNIYLSFYTKINSNGS